METRIKVHETNGDHHGYIEWIEKLSLGYLPVEDWRKRRTNGECRITVENLRVITHENVTEVPRLGFSSRKHVFSPKTIEMHSIGVRGPLEQPPSAYLLKKRSGACRRARPGELCSPKQVGVFLRKLLEASPFFTKFTPFFVIYGKVTEALREDIRLDFLPFSLPSHSY